MHIRTANSKMVTLAEVASHDILNQMTALSAYLDLLAEKPNDTTASNYLDTMKKILEVIRLQIEFTHDYQELGIKEPSWRDIRNAFDTAAKPFADHPIVFTCDTGQLEIYADALIERVFYNLIDNSIRHGGSVSAIRLSVEKADPDLILVYADDGVGIPLEEKEKIFLKGFGKHTGLGMFLIKEILSITGMTIRETGTFQRGVHFEIEYRAAQIPFAIVPEG